MKKLWSINDRIIIFGRREDPGIFKMESWKWDCNRKIELYHYWFGSLQLDINICQQIWTSMACRINMSQPYIVTVLQNILSWKLKPFLEGSCFSKFTFFKLLNLPIYIFVTTSSELVMSCALVFCYDYARHNLIVLILKIINFRQILICTTNFGNNFKNWKCTIFSTGSNKFYMKLHCIEILILEFGFG